MTKSSDGAQKGGIRSAFADKVRIHDMSATIPDIPGETTPTNGGKSRTITDSKLMRRGTKTSSNRLVGASSVNKQNKKTQDLSDIIKFIGFDGVQTKKVQEIEEFMSSNQVITDLF